MDLISYGSISKDFKIMAQLTNLFNKIKFSDIKETRLDCYDISKHFSIAVKESIDKKFNDIKINIPTNIEVFYPSVNYPSHVDGGGISYFIPLEEGLFLIEGVNYSIVPFVLYAFEDCKLHNTNFGAIMLK